MYISETRTVRHDIDICGKDDLHDYLLEEVERAWRENTCGKVSAEWGEDYVIVTVKVGDMALSRVKYSAEKDSWDYEKE